MQYNVINKTTGNIQGRGLTHKALMKSIALFIAFNPSKKPLITDQDKIDYYSEQSFYKIVEA